MEPSIGGRGLVVVVPGEQREWIALPRLEDDIVNDIGGVREKDPSENGADPAAAVRAEPSPRPVVRSARRSVSPPRRHADEWFR